MFGKPYGWCSAAYEKRLGAAETRQTCQSRGRFCIMREVAVPPVATVSDAANLTDPVWDNAEQFPDDAAP